MDMQKIEPTTSKTTPHFGGGDLLSRQPSLHFPCPTQDLLFSYLRGPIPDSQKVAGRVPRQLPFEYVCCIHCLEGERERVICVHELRLLSYIIYITSFLLSFPSEIRVELYSCDRGGTVEEKYI